MTGYFSKSGKELPTMDEVFTAFFQENLNEVSFQKFDQKISEDPAFAKQVAFEANLRMALAELADEEE